MSKNQIITIGKRNRKKNIKQFSGTEGHISQLKDSTEWHSQCTIMIMIITAILSYQYEISKHEGFSNYLTAFRQKHIKICYKQIVENQTWLEFSKHNVEFQYNEEK